MNIDRRQFIQLAGATPLLGTSLPSLAAQSNAKKLAPDHSLKKLVLIKLVGGNDGLNTLVPLKDYLRYAKLRPQLAIPQHKARQFPLEDGMALNPYLQRLYPWWKRGQMAWVQGVGYPDQILSHFESNDIWETASKDPSKRNGWLSYVVPRYRPNLHGIVIGDELGTLAGKNCHAVAMQSPEVFLSQISILDQPQPIGKARNPALGHVVNIQQQVMNVSHQLRTKMDRPRPLGLPFANSELGRKLESVAKMIVNGVDAPVYVVELTGFDTHADQLNRQNHLFDYLGSALDSFAKVMVKHGHWNNTLVMTYSEFGRRVAQNHAGGTDHGAASVQLLMGGRVRGGLYGERPRLDDLDSIGNLPMTTDFRDVYATIASRWHRQSHPWANYKTLNFI